MKKIDSQWQNAQELVFVDWINDTLKDSGTVVNNLEDDLKTGIVLIQFIEKLTGHKVHKKYEKNPTYKIQFISNCDIALKFIHNEFGWVPNCSAENIVNGGSDFKYLLGLLFLLYLQIHKSKVVTSHLPKKQEEEYVLEWAQNTLCNYPILLFTTDQMMNSFYDGTLLVALVDLYFSQNGVFFDWMLKKSYGERLGISLRIARDLIHITEIITTEDVLSRNVDGRVFLFYMDLFMTAFANRKNVIQINLVELVINALNEFSTNQTSQKSSQEQTITSDQKDVTFLFQDSGKESCEPKQTKNYQVIQKQSEKKEMEKPKEHRPIVLKDILHQGRVGNVQEIDTNERSVVTSQPQSNDFFRGSRYQRHEIMEPTTRQESTHTNQRGQTYTVEEEEEKGNEIQNPQISLTEEIICSETLYSTRKSGMRHRRHHQTYVQTRQYRRVESTSPSKHEKAEKQKRYEETVVYGTFWFP
ncbi:Calponin domain family protein [Entamoeba marina]